MIVFRALGDEPIEEYVDRTVAAAITKIARQKLVEAIRTDRDSLDAPVDEQKLRDAMDSGHSVRTAKLIASGASDAVIEASQALDDALDEEERTDLRSLHIRDGEWVKLLTIMGSFGMLDIRDPSPDIEEIDDNGAPDDIVGLCMYKLTGVPGWVVTVKEITAALQALELTDPEAQIVAEAEIPSWSELVRFLRSAATKEGFIVE